MRDLLSLPNLLPCFQATVPGDMTPGICLPVTLCWVRSLRKGLMSWSEKEEKQLLIGTVEERKSVLQFLKLVVLKMLYLAYSICIFSRLNFSLPMFVHLSTPLRKGETWSETLCAWRERWRTWCQPMTTHSLPRYLCWLRAKRGSKLQEATSWSTPNH